MSKINIDLTNCDREPIHIPGSIQPHGFLFGIDSSGKIFYCSENIYAVFRIEAKMLLGKHLSVFLDTVAEEGTASAVFAIISLFFGGLHTEQLNPTPLRILGRDYNLIVSGAGAYMIMELEPAMPELHGKLQKMIGYSLSRMLIDKNLDHLIANAAEQVRAVIGFDRVMVYRFAGDGHGEVIAESKNEKLESWVGQHFPASDIPQQARELYKKNLTRLISNVADTPVGVFSLEGHTDLDMTHAQLRAVSPVHIQYLMNMGVSSSFSISVIYKTGLWGLIACHNYTPKFIEFTARDSAKLIGQILSSALEFRQDELNHQIHEGFTAHLDQLSKQMISDDSLTNALTGYASNLLSIVKGTGAVIYFDNTLTSLGDVPFEQEIKRLATWLLENQKDQFFYTDHIASVFSDWSATDGMHCGLMFLAISRELGEYVIFFKPEQRATISWAGNPHLEKERKSDGLMHISPRNSFELWAQAVTGKSLPWSLEEVSSVTRLRNEISYALNLKANTVRFLNDRLTVAYDELNTFSYSVSHDLKNPISSIKVYAQLLLRDLSLSDRSRQISVKIESGAAKMNRMVEEVLEYSRIGRIDPDYSPFEIRDMIQEICEELRLVYHLNCPAINFGELHNIYADPAMAARVFSNVIGNAAKYCQSHASPEIRIESVIEDGLARYSITDNGIGIQAVDMPRIFDLFSRMSNVGSVEGTGVGLAIVKRIIERHKGRIWADHNPTGGTVFHVVFQSIGNIGEKDAIPTSTQKL